MVTGLSGVGGAVVLLALLAGASAGVGLAPARPRATPVPAGAGAGRGHGPVPPAREVSGLLRRWRATRDRADRRAAEELGVVGTIAAALEAGLPVARAVRLAVPDPPDGSTDGADWRPLARAAAEGQALAPAWDRLGRTTSSPTLTAVARSWAVASRSGAPIGDALRTSAHVARERQRLERAISAASAGARATATVLTWLPLAGVALSAVLGVGPVELYGSPSALLCLGAGATLLLVGRLLVRRLVARVVAELR